MNCIIKLQFGLLSLGYCTRTELAGIGVCFFLLHLLY